MVLTDKESVFKVPKTPESQEICPQFGTCWIRSVGSVFFAIPLFWRDEKQPEKTPKTINFSLTHGTEEALKIKKYFLGPF